MESFATKTFNEICKLVLGKLSAKLDKTVYSLWLQDLCLFELSPQVAIFTVPSDFKREVLLKHYTNMIGEALQSVIGFPVEIKVESTEHGPYVLPQPPKPAPMEFVPDTEEDDIGADPDRVEIRHTIEGKRIDEENTFDNFIVGESNKFACAAARSVANDPGNSYNPLFIHGPSGIGKTHLLIAITNEIKRNRPDVKIIYKHGEEFTNELIGALQSGAMERFRARYRMTDVLLIDDIQFIAGKASTQEEFFWTFSTLYENKKQIILTSDRPPKEITPLEDRLRTRFEWGLIADIQPPSEELRTAIIKKKAEMMGILLPPDCISFLTSSLQKDIRQIEGAIRKIASLVQLFHMPVNLDTCREAVKDLVNNEDPSPITVDRILHIVAEHYNVPVEEIRGSGRQGQVATARHMCIYLIRDNTSLSLADIGKIFGRDHSTAISSINKIKLMKTRDTTMDSLIQALNRKIAGE